MQEVSRWMIGVAWKTPQEIRMDDIKRFMYT